MKINEIIMEGPFSWLANRMVGRASAKSGKKDFQKTIGALMHGWDSYVQRAGLDLKTNPAQYKQFLDMYLKKAIGFESTLQTQLASRQDVANYIQSVYQEKAKSDLLPAATNARAPEPSAPAQPVQPSMPVTATPADNVTPAAGRRIVVTAPNGGKYYQTSNGWTNVNGDKVVSQKSIEYLNNLVDDGSEKEEPVPEPLPPQQPQPPAQPPRSNQQRRQGKSRR